MENVEPTVVALDHRGIVVRVVEGVADLLLRRPLVVRVVELLDVGGCWPFGAHVRDERLPDLLVIDPHLQRPHVGVRPRILRGAVERPVGLFAVEWSGVDRVGVDESA